MRHFIITSADNGEPLGVIEYDNFNRSAMSCLFNLLRDYVDESPIDYLPNINFAGMVEQGGANSINSFMRYGGDCELHFYVELSTLYTIPKPPRKPSQNVSFEYVNQPR